MNIYNFDKTIYKSNTSIDFFLFTLRRNLKILFVVPSLFWFLILYIINLKEEKELKEKFFSFLKYEKNVDELVKKFWIKNRKKIKKFYIDNKKSNDIIISSSPEFLLKPICKELGVNLIATVMDKDTGKIIGNDCYDKEKVNRLYKEKKTDKCKNFYSNSYSDLPLANIAENSYMVVKDKIYVWNEYKESLLKKTKNMFFAKDFMFFVLIGLINTIDVVWMSLAYSTVMNDTLGFVFGWTTSLCVAYTLNSLLNFKEKLSFKKLIAFAISNIPNFIIQNLTAYIVLDILKLNKLLSYFIAAIIGVPVTFICIKIFVFKKKERK